MTENQIPYEQEEEINLVSLLFTVLHKYRQMAAAAWSAPYCLQAWLL